MKKYIRPFTNYRKSKKGDGHCQDCIHNVKPMFTSQRLRCGNYKFSQAVSKKNTCDGFHKKEAGKK